MKPQDVIRENKAAFRRTFALHKKTTLIHFNGGHCFSMARVLTQRGLPSNKHNKSIHKYLQHPHAKQFNLYHNVIQCHLKTTFGASSQSWLIYFLHGGC